MKKKELYNLINEKRAEEGLESTRFSFYRSHQAAGQSVLNLRRPNLWPGHQPARRHVCFRQGLRQRSLRIQRPTPALRLRVGPPDEDTSLRIDG